MHLSKAIIDFQNFAIFIIKTMSIKTNKKRLIMT